MKGGTYEGHDVCGRIGNSRQHRWRARKSDRWRKRTVKVCEVQLYRHVVQPGLDPIVPPLGVDGVLEDESIGLE